MKKTHKRILGFAGLGLVAAVTTAAAVIPSPTALATDSQTDTLIIRVIPSESDIQMTTPYGPEVNEPNYEFDVHYSGISDISVVLVNKDDDGNIIFGPTTLWIENVDWNPGSKHFGLNLDDYGGYGNFTFTATGLGHGGVPVERYLTVKYGEGIQDIFTDTKGEGYGIVGDLPAGTEVIETEVYDTDGGGGIVRIIRTNVNTGVTDVYDKDGHLIISIPDGYDPTGRKTLVYMGGTPDGVYPGRIMFLNGDGDPIGPGIKVRIHWAGDEEEPVVPDTGGFFQGLNISREDYLITGAIVFMIIGVVAFGIVKRNRSSKK